MTPDKVTHVPGLLDDIVDWIVANTHCPCREFALGVAVTVIGTLIGQRAAEAGSETRLYAICIPSR
jgi:hypothetical protein